MTRGRVSARAFGTRSTLYLLPVFGLIVVALGACSAAHISQVVRVRTDRPAPTTILVDVAPVWNMEGANAEMRVATDALRSGVLVQLAKQGMTAAPLSSASIAPGSAVLRIRVSEADAGNQAARMIIGFGAGRARLQVRAELESADGGPAQPMTSFAASSDSGRRPGLLVPGGVAIASASVVPLAINGAVGVASNLRGSLDRPIKQASSAIVGQLRDYYRTVGWPWPGDH